MNTKNNVPSPKQTQKGFTLVEVLVTLLVVSIGLLGVAKLQVLALKNSYATYQRSVASAQTQDLVERLWAGMCVLGDVNKRSAIVAEWRKEHENRPATKISMPDWSGSLVVDNYIYQVTVSWTDYRGSKSGIGAAQSFKHFTSIPSVGCT